MSIPIAQNLPTDLAKALRPLRSSAVKSQSALAEVVPQTGCRPGDLATFPRAGERKFCAPWMQRPSVLPKQFIKNRKTESCDLPSNLKNEGRLGVGSILFPEGSPRANTCTLFLPAPGQSVLQFACEHLESVATGHRS